MQNSWSKLFIIIIPILAAILASCVNVPEWAMWGERPLEHFPVLAQLTHYLVTPLSGVAYTLFTFTMPFVGALSVLPLIGDFLAMHFPYVLFTAFLALRYCTTPNESTSIASFIGTLIIFLVCLLTLLVNKGSIDGQAGVAIAIGFYAALLLAVISTEVIYFFWKRRH